MTNTTSAPNAPQNNTPVPARKNFLYIFIVLLAFMLSGLLGYYAQKIVVEKKEQSLNPSAAKSAASPLESIVGNPMFSQWSARVKGKMTEANATSFIISPIIEQYQPNGERAIIDLRGNRPTKIYIVKDKTKFYQTAYQDGVPQKTQITYENIPINSIIEGSVDLNPIDGSFDLIALVFSLQQR